MRIISIDPGYEKLGIAILEGGRTDATLLHSECFKTSSKMPHHTRLCLIGDKIHEMIRAWKPLSLSLETLFFNTNQKTATKVSEARGVILYAATKEGLHVLEYTPLQVKIAVTGYGRSDKSQVISMVQKLVKFPKGTSAKKEDDEYDAIAVGLTCLASHAGS